MQYCTKTIKKNANEKSSTAKKRLCNNKKQIKINHPGKRINGLSDMASHFNAVKHVFTLVFND